MDRFALLFALLFVACQPTKDVTTTTTEDTCADALARLTAMELAMWHGLPRCSADELGRAWKGGGGEAGHGRLSHRPTRFRRYQIPGQPYPAMAWFDAEDRPRLIWIVAPRLADPAAILAALGPPPFKLPQGAGHHADATQWVYPDRGLALYVRELDRSIARIAVFVPTTAEVYRTELGAEDKPEYLPRR